MTPPERSQLASRATSPETEGGRRRRFSPWGIAAAIVLLAFLAFGGDRLLLLLLLERREQPRKAELIVVFAGGGGSRFRHAIALMRAGFANKILFIGTRPEMRFAKSVTQAEGAEEIGQLVFVRPQIPSTFASARFLRDYILGEHYEQVILVSSPEHGFRIELSFSKLLHGDRFTRIYCPARRTPGQEPGRFALWVEALKALWYLLRY